MLFGNSEFFWVDKAGCHTNVRGTLNFSHAYVVHGKDKWEKKNQERVHLLLLPGSVKTLN
jgi:hypothetical protein